MPAEARIKPYEDIPPTNNHELDIFIPSADTNVDYDLEKDEDEILKRYESIYRTLVSNKVCKPLTRRYDEKDLNKNIQFTIIDWCTCHALQGEDYINEIQMNMQYNVLQSALILTISMPLYISPPDFGDDTTAHAFSAVVGGAAFCQLGSIIGCTIASALLNRPFTGVDTMIARIEAQTLLVLDTVINYIGNLMTVSAMFIAGFARTFLDGAVQLFAVVMIISLFYIFIRSDQRGSGLQDIRILQFYTKYCDDNGRLKREYLLRIYAPKENKKEY